MGESVSLLTYSGQYLFQITLYWIFLSKMRKQTLCSQRFLNSLQGFLIRNPRGGKNFDYEYQISFSFSQYIHISFD